METIEACKWQDLLTRAQHGDSDAQWEVGYYHEHGANVLGRDVVQKNRAGALHWYTLAAESGNSDAQLSLSNLLSDRADGGNFKEAIYWANKAIAQGNASAAFNLGCIYRDLKKPNLAFKAYQRALSMGDRQALLQIGLCQLLGVGTKQDLAAAATSFNTVHSSHSDSVSQRARENALYWSALLQLLGAGGVKKSITGARALLKGANADDDHEQANELLNLIGK